MMMPTGRRVVEGGGRRAAFPVVAAHDGDGVPQRLRLEDPRLPRGRVRRRRRRGVRRAHIDRAPGSAA
eukprot:31271-Pelagococcus_subviridis.AAC.8